MSPGSSFFSTVLISHRGCTSIMQDTALQFEKLEYLFWTHAHHKIKPANMFKGARRHQPNYIGPRCRFHSHILTCNVTQQNGPIGAGSVA